MSVPTTKPCDVFIAHGTADRTIAREIADGLEGAGLAAFYGGELDAGADVGDAIWKALAESRALIAIVSPHSPAGAMEMVEIGAAETWNKPIFRVLNGSASSRLSPFMEKYPVYPINRVADLIGAIRAGFEPLTDGERSTLGAVYQELQIPADQLSQSPDVLRKLTDQFNGLTGKKFSGERLLSEIWRLRKKGELPRLRKRAS